MLSPKARPPKRLVEFGHFKAFFTFSASELFIGGKIVEMLSDTERESLNGASLHDGVKAAANALKTKVKTDLGV